MTPARGDSPASNGSQPPGSDSKTLALPKNWPTSEGTPSAFLQATCMHDGSGRPDPGSPQRTPSGFQTLWGTPRQSHLGPRPDGAPIRGGVFVHPRALSPASFGQFPDQRRTSLHTAKETFNVRSPWGGPIPSEGGDEHPFLSRDDPQPLRATAPSTPKQCGRYFSLRRIGTYSPVRHKFLDAAGGAVLQRSTHLPVPD